MPRIDFTPMVDLGFLLITFFIFTTTMSDPKVIDINMPYNPPPPGTSTAYIESATMTIIPSAAHKVYVYYGTLKSKDGFILTDINKLRNLVTDKQRALREHPASSTPDAAKLHVIIKPDSRSTYQDLIAILDEMAINAVPYYAIADITDMEQEWLTEKLQ